MLNTRPEPKPVAVAVARMTTESPNVSLPLAQHNFTDPESKIMKTSDGSFHQCFYAQTVVDAEHQVIVATGRQKHDDPTAIGPRGRIPSDATPRQRMARKLTTEAPSSPSIRS